MSEPLSRAQALRVLALTSAAEPDDIKRAYRRLARTHHPDLGGDPAVFHELQRAVERLADDVAPSPPRVSRGRPSRPAPTATEGSDGPASDRVDWEVPTPVVGMPVTRDSLAVALVDPGVEQVGSVTATSRAPGSRLNRFAPHLAGNTTSELRLFPATDDRGRPVLTVEIHAWSRRGRRALQAANLQGRWARIQGSSSTLLRSNLVPAEDGPTTVARAVMRVEELLDGIDWGFEAWRFTALRARPPEA